jgi:hypothetical protein
MNQFKKTSVALIILIFCLTSNAQIIDNYGIRIGVGLASQYWNFNNEMASDLSDWKEIKPGLTVYINAEKLLNNNISIRPEFGYIQKGFVEDIELTNNQGEPIGTNKSSVILHDLSIDISTKIIPLQSKFKPYFVLGFRGDILVGYKDYMIEFQGEEYGVYEEILDDYNKFVLSGLIGIGLDCKGLIYIDLEFNPAITKNLDNSGLSIKDRYFGLTIGLNINALTKENK